MWPRLAGAQGGDVVGSGRPCAVLLPVSGKIRKGFAAKPHSPVGRRPSSGGGPAAVATALVVVVPYFAKASSRCDIKGCHPPAFTLEAWYIWPGINVL